MAALPDALPLADPNAPGPAIAGVAPTDFGLEQAGGELEAASRRQVRAQMMQARAQSAVDKRSIEPQVQQLAASNDLALKTDGAAYTGEQPGFAAAHVKDADARVGQFVDPNWTAGQKSEFTVAAHRETARTGANAYALETAKRAAPIEQAAALAQMATLNNGVIAYDNAFEQAKHDVYLNHQATDTDLPTKILAASDAAAKTALDQVPDYLKPKLQAEIQAKRVNAAATAQVDQATIADAHLTQTAGDQIGTIVGGIRANPGGFDQGLANVSRVTATLPKSLQDPFQRSGETASVDARIDGLIAGGHPDVALQELTSGKYDNLLHGPQAKENLIAKAQSAVQGYEPRTAVQQVAAHNFQDKVTAEVRAQVNGDSTGLSLDGAEATLGQNGAAQARLAITAAQRLHAAEGPIPAMTNDQLAAASHAPDVDPKDPDYVVKQQVIEAQRKLAADELTRRQTDPAAALFDTSKKGPPTKGVGATSQSIQVASNLNQGWQTVTTTSGQQQEQAGRDLALNSLGLQAAQGVPESQRRLVPQAYAQGMAATFQQANPDQKLKVASQISGVVQSLPGSVQLHDGSWTNPQAIFLKQLRDAGMSAESVSALVDFGNNSAAMGRYIQAVLDPKVNLKPDDTEKNKINTLEQKVTGELKKFLDVSEPLPGSSDLYRARVTRTLQVARSYLADNPSMSLDDAAKAAAQDMTKGYRYQDGYRIPDAQAGGLAWQGYTGHHATVAGYADGAGLIKAGAATALAKLTGGGGANLQAVPGQDPRITSAQISGSARWVTAPDGNGLALMYPRSGQSYDLVRDRYGRPVMATWDQLKGYAKGTADPGFDKAPPQAHYNGQPVPAYSKSQVFGAVLSSITQDGEHGKTGDLGPILKDGDRAYGKYQLTGATVKTFAPQLGLPVDLQRAQYDDDYGQRVAGAALSSYINRYATTPGVSAYGLGVAAYNAGPGNVDKWLAQIGDPRTGKISLDDFMARVPWNETRGYVGRVLPGAVRRLQQGH